MKSKLNVFLCMTLSAVIASSMLLTGCNERSNKDDSKENIVVMENPDENDNVSDLNDDKMDNSIQDENEKDAEKSTEEKSEKKDTELKESKDHQKAEKEKNDNKNENGKDRFTESENQDDKKESLTDSEKEEKEVSDKVASETSKEDTVVSPTNKENTAVTSGKDTGATTGNKTNSNTTVNKENTTVATNKEPASAPENKNQETTVVNKEPVTPSNNKENTVSAVNKEEPAPSEVASNKVNTKVEAPTESEEKTPELVVKEHTHQYNTFVTKKAKCTIDGEQVSTCIICGDTVTEAIPSLGGHKFTETVRREATCSSYGDRVFRCSVCGYAYDESYGELKPHTLTNLRNIDSYTHAYECSTCNQTIYESHNKEVYQTGTGANVKCESCGFDQVLCNYQDLINREFELTNQARIENGLPALTYNAGLQGLVNRRANEIITDFSHNGFRYVIDNEWGNYPSFIGENIAYGYPTSDAVHDGWMNSPGHRANILNADAKSIAIGVVVSPNGNIYWVQIFGLYP